MWTKLHFNFHNYDLKVAENTFLQIYIPNFILLSHIHCILYCKQVNNIINNVIHQHHVLIIEKYTCNVKDMSPEPKMNYDDITEWLLADGCR